MNDLIDIALNSLWPTEKPREPESSEWDAWLPYAATIDTALTREWP